MWFLSTSWFLPHALAVMSLALANIAFGGLRRKSPTIGQVYGHLTLPQLLDEAYMACRSHRGQIKQARLSPCRGCYQRNPSWFPAFAEAGWRCFAPDADWQFGCERRRRGAAAFVYSNVGKHEGLRVKGIATAEILQGCVVPR